MHFAEVKNFLFFSRDGSSKTHHQRSDLRTVYGQRYWIQKNFNHPTIGNFVRSDNSEKKPDESDDDSDSSFVPEEENSDWDGDTADRPLCSYIY